MRTETPKPLAQRRFLNERELAAISGFSIRTLQGWRLRNLGPPFKRINGSSVRYDLEAFLKWFDTQPGGGQP